MAATRKMTSEQLRMAYRDAVERCLVVFFDLDARNAERLVTGWWDRIAVGRGLQTGLFLHGEAIDTAADLARGEEVPLSEENRARYRAVLEEATLRAMRGAEIRDAVAENVLPDGVELAVASADQDTPAVSAGAAALWA